jgi:hypothetical protein
MNVMPLEATHGHAFLISRSEQQKYGANANLAA